MTSGTCRNIEPQKRTVGNLCIITSESSKLLLLVVSAVTEPEDERASHSSRSLQGGRSKNVLPASRTQPDDKQGE